MLCHAPLRKEMLRNLSTVDYLAKYSRRLYSAGKNDVGVPCICAPASPTQQPNRARLPLAVGRSLPATWTPLQISAPISAYLSSHTNAT